MNQECQTCGGRGFIWPEAYGSLGGIPCPNCEKSPAGDSLREYLNGLKPGERVVETVADAERETDWDRRLFERKAQAARIVEMVEELTASIKASTKAEGWEDRSKEVESLRFLRLEVERLKELTAEDYERF